MVAIINYERKTAQRISQFLSELNIENKITLEEVEISSADKIILPHFNDLKSALRKLQLSNVFNLLKVVKKDILGINAGMILFCQYISHENLTGLGILQNVEVCGRTKCDFDSKIEIKNPPDILEHCEDEEFHFSFEYYLTTQENTIAEVEFENKRISAAVKNKNFRAVLFEPENSGEGGKKVIRNFLEEGFE